MVAVSPAFTPPEASIVSIVVMPPRGFSASNLSTTSPLIAAMALAACVWLFAGLPLISSKISPLTRTEFAAEVGLIQDIRGWPVSPSYSLSRRKPCTTHNTQKGIELQVLLSAVGSRVGSGRGLAQRTSFEFAFSLCRITTTSYMDRAGASA